MAKYLGEEAVESLDGTPYEGYSPVDWALEFIERYGQIDGGHHKAWVLDQAARILWGTPVVVTLARWDDGIEQYRLGTGSPSADYLAWAESMKEGGEYDYDEGVAP